MTDDVIESDAAPVIEPDRKRVRAFDVAAGMPWMITAEALAQILTIADRATGESIDALEARLGRRLDNTRSVSMRDGIAVVPVTGPIFRYANLMTELSGATSTAALALDIQQAVDDPSVRGIVLNIDSPGGAAQGINELAAMIRGHRMKKPMRAYVGGTAGSAAYWLASAAEHITIDATALLGSIGVVMTVQDTTKRDMKKDVRDIEIVSSVSPEKRVDITTESGRGRMQNIVDALASVFVASVADNRGVSEETVRSDFGRGGLLVGARAVEAGMADRIGSLESVIDDMVKATSAPNFRRAAMAEAEQKDVKAVATQTVQTAVSTATMPAEDPVKVERERIRAILEGAPGPHAHGAAMVLAFESNMGADEAVALLNKIAPVAAAPKQTAGSDFQRAMASFAPGIASQDVSDDAPKVPAISHIDVYADRAKARSGR